MNRYVAEAFWLSFAIAAVLAWPTLLLLRKIRSEGMISPYTPEHQVKAGTPNMGGIFVIIAVLVSLLVKTEGSATLVIVVACFAAIGFLDDFVLPRATGKRGLGWMPKLVLEVVVVALAMFIDSTISAWTAFSILFFANAVNFADGLDALAGSLFIFATIPFIVFFTSAGVALPAALGAAAIGALLPFLVLNAPPAKVFMGDVGSLALGAGFGYMFAGSPWQTTAWPWVVALIFIIELALVPIQIVAVKTIKRRVFPATPIHHGFEKIGWPESRIVWLFVVAQVILSSAALTEILA